MRRILLVQLPIPPVGPQPIRGNVPLAAGYLKLFARQRGLESISTSKLFPPTMPTHSGDQGLVEAILDRDPGWSVSPATSGISNHAVDCQRIKERRPDIRILIGGPEVTLDNAWVSAIPAVDYADHRRRRADVCGIVDGIGGS